MYFTPTINRSLSVRWKMLAPIVLLMILSCGGLTVFFFALFSDYQARIVDERAGHVAANITTVLHAAHDVGEVSWFIDSLVASEDIEQILVVDRERDVVIASSVQMSAGVNVADLSDQGLVANLRRFLSGEDDLNKVILDDESATFAISVVCRLIENGHDHDVLVYMQLHQTAIIASSSIIVQKLGVGLLIGLTFVMLIVSKLIYDVVLSPLSKMKRIAVSPVVDMATVAPFLERDDEFGALARNIVGSFRSANETAMRFAEQARKDSLTQLGSRLFLRERLQDILADADVAGGQVALLVIDLENFRKVNDTFGHNMGDALLIEFAHLLLTVFRPEDTLVRLSSDEFAVIVEGEDCCSVAVDCAEQVFALLASPLCVEGVDIHIGSRAGITVFPQDGRDVDVLFKNADLALAQARLVQSDRLQIYQHSMQLKSIEQRAIEQDLRIALAEEQFVLYYQPKVDLIRNRICGAEALVRWQHPERGMVPPDRFIPVAEKNGLICKITEWVLLETCKQIRSWLDQGIDPMCVAINVSALDLRRPEFTDIVAAALVRTGVSPKYLEIEVTESTMMHDVDQVIGMLRRLRALGIKISIDDFGTGYSSLAYLQRFPVQRLKIDRSFVMDMSDDPNTQAIPRLIIELSRTLGVQVLAEGVETDAQKHLLLSMGCEEAQGYLFGGPVPAQSFAARLTSGLDETSVDVKPSVAVSVA